MTKPLAKYYITKETVIEVGLTKKQAKDKIRKYKGTGMLHLKSDPY